MRKALRVWVKELFLNMSASQHDGVVTCHNGGESSHFWFLMLMMTTQFESESRNFFEHVGESTCRRGHMSSCRRVESFLVFDDDDDDDPVESRVKDLFFEHVGESTCVVVTCHHVGESSLFLVFDDDDDEDDEDDDPVV